MNKVRLRDRLKKPFLFALALLPVAIVGGYFVAQYQLFMYDQATIDLITEQMGSTSVVVLSSVIQTILYGCVLGFFGYILSEKLGLIRPFRFEKKALLRTIAFSIVLGVLFSLDYWTFGKWIPELGASNATAAGLTAAGWIGSVLYGGIVEEVMLRLFCMSLIAWLGWKIFYRKRESVPTGVLVGANVISALLFAAGHLPATVSFFGGLTPMLLLRCFLLNGGFGLYFGWLYRKRGIQYAMLAHMLLHIISKLVWTLFI